MMTLQELFGIRLPVIQAPMAGSQGSDRRRARGIMNRLMKELGPINDAAPAFPLAAGALAPLRKSAESLGSGDFSPLWAGQNVSGCQQISAAALTRALIR